LGVLLSHDVTLGLGKCRSKKMTRSPLLPEDKAPLMIVREELERAEARLYDHISQTFRWIMATLFAANGGAILAMIDHPDFARGAGPVALLLFGAGLLLSIGVGITSAFVTYRASVRLNQLRGEVWEMLLSGLRNEDTLPKLQAMKPTWHTFGPSYLGILSLMCLVGGIAVAAASIVERPPRIQGSEAAWEQLFAE
jgi:hypothetical protein